MFIRKLTKIFILLGILLFSITLVGCNNNSTKSDEEMIIDIYCDYINSQYGYSKFSRDDQKIKYYLGKYGEAHCAIIEGDRPVVDMVPYYVEIEGEKFKFKCVPETISVYYKDKYYHLIEACEEGILTLEDVRSLHEYCTNNIFNK